MQGELAQADRPPYKVYGRHCASSGAGGGLALEVAPLLHRWMRRRCQVLLRVEAEPLLPCRLMRRRPHAWSGTARGPPPPALRLEAVTWEYPQMGVAVRVLQWRRRFRCEVWILRLLPPEEAVDALFLLYHGEEGTGWVYQCVVVELASDIPQELQYGEYTSITPIILGLTETSPSIGNHGSYGYLVTNGIMSSPCRTCDTAWPIYMRSA